MELLDIKTGDLARENFAIIQLFKRNNIDFFCKGSRTLKEAVAESGTEQEKFLKELNEIRSRKPLSYAVNVEKWPLDLLADYVQKIHHRYTEGTLMKIKEQVKRMPATDPEVTKIIGEFNTTFEFLSGELAKHMKKEELMLFPAIRKLAAKSGGSGFPAFGPAAPKAPAGNVPMFGSVDTLVATMIDEHDMQYQALRKIREILHNYTSREGKEDYNKLLQQMHELDEDLALHIHLENNILFPKAVELMKKS